MVRNSFGIPRILKTDGLNLLCPAVCAAAAVSALFRGFAGAPENLFLLSGGVVFLQVFCLLLSVSLRQRTAGGGTEAPVSAGIRKPSAVLLLWLPPVLTLMFFLFLPHLR